MTSLTFLGATGQVTGSCYLLEIGTKRILLDCGLFQGSKETEKQNEADFPFDPAAIDAVVLSHAHLDHCGRLPKLVKEGFKGPVFLTEASFPLLELMLMDAAHLQLRDTEWENKRRERAGKPLLEPLYTEEDVKTLLSLRRPIAYGVETEILPGLSVSFHEAGHILGSSIVRLRINDEDKTKTLVFSGDLGNMNSPLMRDPAVLTEADVLLLESTYGDRDHKPLENTLEELSQTLAQAAKSGGNVIIPSFAVGRTQDLIYWLGKIQRQGGLPQREIYLDSPMAISASNIYADNTHLFNIDDPEFTEIAPDGWQAWLRGLIYSQTAEESMAVNQIAGGAIIIAGSGMCNGGRIRHHLKYNLWRSNAHIVIAGFQAEGTLGRAIVDGKKSHLKILGDEINVAATVHTLGALSAHADQSQLLKWAGHFSNPKPRLYLIHGEKSAALSLQTCFKRSGWTANIPGVGERIII
ncbi:MBL fold metallo-hydrolase RNA specificity domain-containing protein [Candidatus Methylobacter oryzae]|uniref:MBL fold metallo-hydrolase n=1 Tax=Candidatus Methylobacter oryzae TaxID=2497749 RepID=A0ABY3C5R9_9GAMM|nr:MBL fold metallo-hydrolase [Candidatus Methylobacter oryzae]TRW90354.1 MBL fold metallo-hydrolase [Candidatus Methylobacter oryzae]